MIFKIVSPEEFLKVYFDKEATRNSLSFQLTSISGKIPTLKDSKICNVSLTRIGEKRKRNMTEPIETVIIRTQQIFETASGINPVKIEIKKV